VTASQEVVSHLAVVQLVPSPYIMHGMAAAVITAIASAATIVGMFGECFFWYWLTWVVPDKV